MAPSLRFARIPALLVASLGLAAGPPPAQRGRLVELGDVEAFSTQNLISKDFSDHLEKDLPKRYQEFKKFGPMLVFQQMFQESAAALVPSRKFTYTSEDSHGPGRPVHARLYSGRVFLPPPPKEGTVRPVPLVVYQHATETRQAFTPYFGKGDETLLGAMAAAMGGFAVVMPDGDGMGVDTQEMHHYCFGDTAAKCVIDCIRAVIGDANLKDGDEDADKPACDLFDDPKNPGYEWDGRVFIVGYSEGGFIAMATVKALSTEPAYQYIPLTGAACMAGPFDFSRSTLDLLAPKNTAPYDRPYIPAYFLKAWQAVAPDMVDFNKAVNPTLLTPRDAKSLPANLLKLGGDKGIGTWLDGTLGGDPITLLVQERLSSKGNAPGDPEKTFSAREILSAPWCAANLDTPSSSLNTLIKANDLVGNWKPRAPILLAHDPFDQTVAYSNSNAMYQAWLRAGTNPPPQEILDLSVGQVGAGHVGGAILAIPSAFTWIGAGMPPSLGRMPVEALQSKVRSTAKLVMSEESAEALARSVDSERKQDDPVLPLSRLAILGKGNFKITFDDLWSVIGKAKFYTLQKAAAYPGQPKIDKGNGITGYPKLVGEMRKKGDYLDTSTLKGQDLADPSSLYMAVYPQNGFVAFTLKFAGPGGPYIMNIKQALKNKVLNRKAGVHLSPGKTFTSHFDKDSYEDLTRNKPFIWLP